MKQLTTAHCDALIILAAEKLGLEPRYVDEAKEVLLGKNIHIVVSADMNKHAARLRNNVADNTEQITEANKIVGSLKLQYGYT